MKRSLKILLAALLLPLTLLWGELFTRVLLPQNVDTILDILVPDSELGYVYAPGAVTRERGRDYDVPFVTNSLGLRDREYASDPGDAFRVLLAGDSFAVSHGESLQHSLAAQIERALAAELAAAGRPRRVEVVNAANAGYTPYNYWKSYRRWGPVLHPQAVVVALFTGNDYISEAADVRFLVSDGLVQARYREGEAPKLRRKSVLHKVRKALARNSELYVLLRNYFYYNEQVDRLLGRDGDDAVALEQLRPFLNPPPEVVTKGWARTADYLGRLQADCATDSVALLILRVPVRLEVDTERRALMAQIASAQGAGLAVEQPAQAIAAICRERALPLLDPLPAIQARHAEAPCFFTFDDHWNRRGMEEAAAFAAREWRALGLPPFE